MVEKVLHAGNVSACVGAVVTAAETSLFGGATLLISGLLSGVAIYKGLKPAEQSLAQAMAHGLDGYLSRAHLGGDRKRIVVQMLHAFPPAYADLARGNMVAERIALNMRDHVSVNATDPAHKSQTALADYAEMLRALLAPVLVPSDINQAMLAELLARTDQSGQSDRLHAEGITENAIIRLAQRIARGTDDLGQAWLELQNAMDIAVRVQQEGRITSNHGDFVDEVLSRVASLAADGNYGTASTAIAEALAEEEAQHQARKSRLLDSGAEVAMLEGNSAQAADYLIQKADLDAGGRAGFEALRALRRTHYVEGRDKGLSQPLEISIDIARLILARATTDDERGTALIDLATSLATLGARESGTLRLEEAIAAYRDALQEITRDRVPLDWATAMMNLANALKSLGDRESGTERLEEAVAAYRDALTERTRDRVPLDWATAMMNLGNALAALGDRESGTGRLEEAIAAYRDALQEYTRDGVPLDWAMAKMNLGAALQTLGARESGTERLVEAIAAYRDALQEYTRDRVPLDWARTMMNLGTALQTLGERESGTERLEEAIAAYRDALQEITRDRVPLYWAMAMMNLANALKSLGARESGTGRLEEAATAYRDALEEFTRDRVPLYWAMAKMNLGNALKSLGERENDTDRLEEAAAAYRDALKEYTRDLVPLDWAMVQGNLCTLELAMFDKTREAAHLDRAQAYLEDARAVFAQAGASQYLAWAEAQQSGIDKRRAGG